jgi:hypothetical protein
MIRTAIKYFDLWRAWYETNVLGMKSQYRAILYAGIFFLLFYGLTFRPLIACVAALVGAVCQLWIGDVNGKSQP